MHAVEPKNSCVINRFVPSTMFIKSVHRSHLCQFINWHPHGRTDRWRLDQSEIWKVCKKYLRSSESAEVLSIFAIVELLTSWNFCTSYVPLLHLLHHQMTCDLLHFCSMNWVYDITEQRCEFRMHDYTWCNS